jgi:transketolase
MIRWPGKKLSDPDSLKALRQAILEQIHLAGSGHPGGSLSLVEILVSIFESGFVQNPQNPSDPARDRFVLSKGHGVPAYYSLLSMLGYFESRELVNLRRLGHFLQGHPDRSQFPLMEASTGSLGQGVSVALGLALALRLDFVSKRLTRLPRVFCVIGDGEMQEGQVWEALMAAGKFKPANLIFVLDRNGGQIDGPVQEVMSLDPLVDKLEAFNWECVEVDGHNLEALRAAFARRSAPQHGSKPLFVVANTVKGKGVGFMENGLKWHGSAPTRDETLRAVRELWNMDLSPVGSLLELAQTTEVRK